MNKLALLTSIILLLVACNQPSTSNQNTAAAPAPVVATPNTAPEVTPQAEPKPAPAMTAKPAKTDSKAAASKTTAAAAPVVYANTVDYICNMEVTPDFTDTCHYKGKAYAFCSEYCKDKFKENPLKYLKK